MTLMTIGLYNEPCWSIAAVDPDVRSLLSYPDSAVPVQK